MAAHDLVAQVSHPVAMLGARSRVLGGRPLAGTLGIDEDEAHALFLRRAEPDSPHLIEEMIGERLPDLIPEGAQIGLGHGSQSHPVRLGFREAGRLWKVPPLTFGRVNTEPVKAMLAEQGVCL